MGKVAGEVPGEVLVWLGVGEPENFKDILDNHEFLRDKLGEVEALGGVPFAITIFSEEVFLDTPGRVGIGCGLVATISCSFSFFGGVEPFCEGGLDFPCEPDAFGTIRGRFRSKINH